MPETMGKDQSLNPYPLILASSSKYRKQLLEQLGVTFDCHPPQVDESEYKQQFSDTSELALTLASVKAKEVFERFPESCVIGSDQVCSLQNRILSKPGNAEKAREQLYSMQGKSHELFTAVSIVYPAGEYSFINRTTLTMRKLTLHQIDEYLRQDTPYDCAGSYKLESHGIKLFEKIEMSDHTAIIGLPLIELATHLIKIGYKL